MPSNRFDTSVQQQYVSQYVPMPFEAIGALGAQTQKAHDAAIDDTYKLKDLMTKVPAIYDPNLGLSNIQKKKELDAQFAPKIDELTNKIYQGDPNAIRELEQVKRDFANNPIRQELEESYLNYKTYKEDAAKKGDAYAIYKDPYRNKALVSETGELQPFRYSGMGEKQDHASEARAQMADIAKMGYDSKNSYLDPTDGNIYTKSSSGKYVKDTRVKELANKKTVDFVSTQKGQDYLQLLKYQNPNATPQELMQGVSNYLFNAGSNQIFSDIGGMSDVQTTSISGDIRKEKQEFAGPMPTYENPTQPTGTTLTPKSGLSWLGVNTDMLNDDGSIHHGLKLTTTPGGIVTKREASGKKELTDFYSSLLNTAKGLGLTIPKKANDKSKTDFDKLQKQLSDYGQNMQLQGNTSAGLQSRFGNNLSDELLGTVTSNSEGATIFKKSPILATAKLTDMSTGESISNIADKEAVAKDGAIRAVDYFASNPGTYRLDSQNKAYEYYPGDKTLNAMTQNTHSLTQEIVKARQGKQGTNTIIEPETTVIKDGKVVKIPAKTVNDYATSITNSLKTNFATIPANDKIGMALATDLSNNLLTLTGYEPVSIQTSDIRIQQGPNRGQPKYQYVAYQQKGFGTTNKADEKILQVDTESGKTEIITLGDLHANERDYLQQNYAQAFEKSK